MHKLSLEGGVGVPQIFKVGREFQKGGAPCSGNLTVRSSALGVAITPMLQAGEGWSRKEPDEEEKREEEPPSQGSYWMFILLDSPWWGWGEGYRGLSDADISDPSSRSGVPCGGWVRRGKLHIFIHDSMKQWMWANIARIFAWDMNSKKTRHGLCPPGILSYTGNKSINRIVNSVWGGLGPLLKKDNVYAGSLQCLQGQVPNKMEVPCLQTLLRAEP